MAKLAASTLVALARDKTNASLAVEQHATTHAVKALKRVKEGRDLVVPHVVKLLRCVVAAPVPACSARPHRPTIPASS